MSSIRTIKRRIKSVHNIYEITKAMEMISAVRFKRIETRFKKSLPFIQGLEQLISRLLSKELVEGNPLFEKRENRKELLITVTGDRGLCGSFNTSLLRFADQYLKENHNRDIALFSIGKVGASFFRRHGLPCWDTLGDLGYKFTPESLDSLINRFRSEFLSGNFDRINILSMSFSKSGVARPLLEPYLGLSYLVDQKPKDVPDRDYIFEPDQKTTLEALIGLFVKQRFFMTLLRSVTAEYNARMIAMKLATDNGKEILKELTLKRNKIRQAMITEEISEIIGGVNALN